jgi:hypothetical protein
MAQESILHWLATCRSIQWMRETKVSLVVRHEDKASDEFSRSTVLWYMCSSNKAISFLPSSSQIIFSVFHTAQAISLEP